MLCLCIGSDREKACIMCIGFRLLISANGLGESDKWVSVLLSYHQPSFTCIYLLSWGLHSGSFEKSAGLKKVGLENPDLV